MKFLSSMESSLNKLFTNKYFLYAVLFLSATTNLSYIMANNINAIGVFVFVAILMVNFSKNMAVILTVSLLAANFFVGSYGYREGMENKEEEEVADEEEEGKQEKKTKDTRSSTGATGDVILPLMDEEADSDAFTSDIFKDSKLDGEKTAMNAYKDLDSILDPNAIDKLTKETMELMQQQQNLFSSMQSMTPLLTQANQLLKGFDMSKLQGLASTASEFTTPAKK
jgi:hypothetical protein